MSDVFTRIEDTIRRELRLAGLFTEPRELAGHPCDLDAEAELCSAALCGYVAPAELALSPSDFWSTLFGQVWLAADAVTRAGREPTVVAVLAAFEANGFRGPALEEELVRLRDTQPFVCRSKLEEQAHLVAELAATRRAIQALDQVALELRMRALRLADTSARLSALGVTL